MLTIVRLKTVSGIAHKIHIHIEWVISRVHNNKSVQLPYGFYTHHLDEMT